VRLTERVIATDFPFLSRNPQAAVSSKHNQTGFGRQPDNSSRPTFAAGAVSTLDEVAKRQCFSFLD